MHVKRFAAAKPYEAPNHRGVVGLRLRPANSLSPHERKRR